MRPPILPLCGLLWVVSCASPSAAVPPVEPSSRAPSTSPEAPPSEGASKAFLGRWVGTLQYRDYTSDKRVSLPTQLEVTPGGDGTSLRFAYVYDDGPGKTVKELSTVIIDSTARQMTVVGEDGDRSVYRFAEDADLGALRQKGEGVFSLSGRGVENGQEVAVRLTLKVDREHYQLLRETQLPGKEFLFRHEYTFTRAG